MHVLLTGGNGFLGAHVCQQLMNRGHVVSVAIRKGSNLERLELLIGRNQRGPTLIRYEDLDMAVGYDAVIHMATNYGRGELERSSLIAANILMPSKLLEKCLENKIGLFINTDSYYTAAGLDHPMAGYILTKRHFVEWARVIVGSRLKFVNMRLEHLYGPMDSSSKFCTAIVRDCLMNKPRIALTAGDQLRDFIHIKDAASAYVTLLDHVDDCGYGWTEIGVGSGEAISLKEFVVRVHALIGSRSVLGFGDLAKVSGEIPCSKADIAFLASKGWRCSIDLEEGIKTLIEQVS